MCLDFNNKLGVLELVQSENGQRSAHLLIYVGHARHGAGAE
jgi:hypothetical protein